MFSIDHRFFYPCFGCSMEKNMHQDPVVEVVKDLAQKIIEEPETKIRIEKMLRDEIDKALPIEISRIVSDKLSNCGYAISDSTNISSVVKEAISKWAQSNKAAIEKICVDKAEKALADSQSIGNLIKMNVTEVVNELAQDALTKAVTKMTRKGKLPLPKPSKK